MDKAIEQGRLFFAVAVAFLGLQQLVYRDFIPGPFIAPAWLPARAFWACLSGATLVLTAMGLLARPKRRLPAAVLAVVLALFFLLFHLTTPLVMVRDGVARTRALETLALAALALVLIVGPAVAAGRLLFALSLVVFGVQHFLYGVFVASVVPSWIPGALAWVYFTGVAMIAAGASLALRIQDRLAATLLGLMFLSWVLLLHLPRVAAHVRSPNEWNSAAVALAMGGAAWILATIARPESGAPGQNQAGVQVAR